MIQDGTERYLVILADRQRSKFLIIHNGTFEDHSEQFFDDVPQKVKAEYTRTGKVQRHIADHLHQHLKLVGKRALEFLVKRKIRKLDGIILGSHKELLHQIEKFLPKRLQNQVIGEFVMDIDLPFGDITEKIYSNFKELSNYPEAKEKSSSSQAKIVR
jgi:peptide subunit release factor 1 (eRF1)